MTNQTNPRKTALLTSIAVLASLALFSTTSAAPNDADVTVVFTANDMGFTATSTKDISNVIVELCDGSVHKHDGLDGKVFVHTETSLIAGVWVKSGDNGIGGTAPPGAGERFDNAGVECEPETPEEPPSSTSTTSSASSTSAAPAQHTICHATGSASNPYVVITLDVSGVFNGHLGVSHHGGRDIIPPFVHEGQTYSQNWDAAHQAIFDNGCEPLPPVTTTTTSTTAPPSEPPETTPPPTTPPGTTPPGEPPVSTPPVSTPPEIPVFPSWSSLALGVMGALAGAFAILRRKLP